MQINAMAVNAPQTITTGQNFKGKRDNINAFINLDDRSIQQIAYLKTIKSVDDRRHRKLDKKLMAAVPVAAGIASAAFLKGKFFTNKGRLEKIMQFSGTTAKWFAAFGIIDLVFAAKNKVEQKSEKAQNFAKNNPLLSFAGAAALSFLAIAGAKKGFGKVLNKYGVKIVDKYDENITKALLKTGELLDNNKILNKIAKGKAKISKKIPSAIKEFGKTLLSWSPVLIGTGAVIHSIDHNKTKMRTFADNYNDLKTKQLNLARKRNVELSLQNDFFLTNPKNKEDLELLKDPKKGLEV